MQNRCCSLSAEHVNKMKTKNRSVLCHHNGAYGLMILCVHFAANSKGSGRLVLRAGIFPGDRLPLSLQSLLPRHGFCSLGVPRTVRFKIGQSLYRIKDIDQFLRKAYRIYIPLFGNKIRSDAAIIHLQRIARK